MPSRLNLEHELIFPDNSAHPTGKVRLRRMHQLITTTKFIPPQPTPYPSLSHASTKVSTPWDTRYVVDLYRPADHDCTTMQHLTPFGCRLWLAKIVHDSHALDFDQACAKVWGFKEDGLRLQAMTEKEVMMILPKRHRLCVSSGRYCGIDAVLVWCKLSIGVKWGATAEFEI